MKSIALSILVALALWGTGCSNEGPAERAGQEIDEAAEDVGEAVDETADDVADAAEDAEEKARKAVD